MIRISEPIYIGNSEACDHADLYAKGINTILNVAHDLHGRRGWSDGFLYAQCGLIDGPGNNLLAYHAAILMLASLLADGRKVLVCCHDGGRSLAVVLMYLHLTGGHDWDGWLKLLRECHDLADPHEQHKKAYELIDWKALGAVFASR